MSGQENEEKEKAYRYTATNPAKWAAMGIQIPSGEDRSAKHIQKSKMMQQIALIKKSFLAAPMLQIQNHPQTYV